MTNNNTAKKVVNHGVAWEQAFGYAQAVQVKDTIYISGQLSHGDDDQLIAPAELDAQGRPIVFSQMEAQIGQTLRQRQDAAGALWCHIQRCR